MDGYEYLSVDGVKRCREVLEDIGSLSGFFLELNACEFACVNGPCSLLPENDAIRSTAAIRKYAGEAVTGKKNARVSYDGVNISAVYSPIKEGGRRFRNMKSSRYLKRLINSGLRTSLTAALADIPLAEKRPGRSQTDTPT